MKKWMINILKIAVILVGITTFAALIRFPQTEGRAANLDLMSIYTDPLIIYIYVASLPFFYGLYTVYKLLGGLTLSALKNLRNSALTFAGFMIGAEAYIITASRNSSDDSAGALMMGFVIITLSVAVAFVASRWHTHAQSTIHT